MPAGFTTPELNVNFHVLLQTLSKFVSDPSGPGTLPLSPSLPDMKTDTESYVRLQNVYRDWAKKEKVVFSTMILCGLRADIILGSFQRTTRRLTSGCSETD